MYLLFLDVLAKSKIYYFLLLSTKLREVLATTRGNDLGLENACGNDRPTRGNDLDLESACGNHKPTRGNNLSLESTRGNAKRTRGNDLGLESTRGTVRNKAIPAGRLLVGVKNARFFKNKNVGENTGVYDPKTNNAGLSDWKTKNLCV